jgi:hypothetical protein
MLAQATTAVGGAVTFAHQATIMLPDPEAYALMQAELWVRELPLRQRGVCTVVLSNPLTSDSVGFAAIDFTDAPYFVMRARAGEEDAVHTAAIFLHELGHQMRLRHEPQPVAGLPWTTDDYWRDAAGRTYLADYVNFVVEE